MEQLNLKGMPEIKKLVKLLNSLGSSYSGAEFLAKNRKELGQGHNTNRHILEWLKEDGRDFLSMTEADIKKIEKAFSDEVVRKTERIASRNAGNFGQALDSIMVSALRKAILCMVGIIQKRVEDGVDFKGSNLKSTADLTEDYKKQKQEKHGFQYPIGVATGQLLDNLNPNNQSVKIVK
jgi:hypothetical protein